MDPRPILSVKATVTIDTLLNLYGPNSSDGLNIGTCEQGFISDMKEIAFKRININVATFKQRLDCNEDIFQ